MISHARSRRRELDKIDQEGRNKKVISQAPSRFLDFYISQNPTGVFQPESSLPKRNDLGFELVLIEAKKRICSLDKIWEYII